MEVTRVKNIQKIEYTMISKNKKNHYTENDVQMQTGNPRSVSCRYEPGSHRGSPSDYLFPIMAQ